MHTAGTDPGYIPGLTSPRPADAKEDAPDEAAERPPEGAAAEEEAAREEAVGAEEASGAEADAAADKKAGAKADTEADVASDGEADDDGEEEDGGVAFEVSDRRGAIRAARRGVTFELDGEKAEFGWDEIGAVEVDTPRFGKRFGITVYTTNRRWYTADVEAPARKLLKEWTAQLDAVLDVYFEDSAEGGAEAEGGGEAKDQAAAGAEGEAGAKGKADTDTKADADAKTGAKAAPDADTDTKAAPEADTDAEADTDSDAKGSDTEGQGSDTKNSGAKDGSTKKGDAENATP
ncbi:MSCRAMM family adhesin SdrC [Streptomyces sp. RKCA744]|uniref:MSCRAMM family adhesin SdrC n=1 Tax=Streptomyces sp. RKCA744 TaxID=2959340 RepID=UPI0020A013AE|nr:MSCRAMM family adhesin SdrC [Streptomyces sp. RKCA744]MCO8306044.1 MSCRAMM family adhesin SdrC [Streptomyces sp. RKCA744]